MELENIRKGRAMMTCLIKVSNGKELPEKGSEDWNYCKNLVKQLWAEFEG